MQRYIIGSVWDRADRNGINSNFEYLFEGDKRIRDLVADFEAQYEGYEDSLQSNFNSFKGQLESIVDSVGGVNGVTEENIANGAVTTNKVAGGAITPDKTTFFGSGSNMFDGNYEHGLLMTQQNNTILMTRGNYGEINGRTAVIEVEPNQKYLIELDVSRSNVLRVGSNSTEIGFPSENHSDYYLDHLYFSTGAGTTQGRLEITTNNNARFLYVYVSNTGQTPSLSIVKSGNEIKLKNEYIDVEGLLGGSVGPEMTSFFTRGGSNLFNGQYEDALLVARDDHSSLEPRYNYGEWTGKTAVIPIEPDTQYTVTVDEDDSNVFRVGTHSTDNAFLNSETTNRLNRTIVSANVDEGPRTVSFKSNATDYYLYVYVSNSGVNADLTVTSSGANLIEYRDGLLTGMTSVGDLRPTLNYNEWLGKTAIFKVRPNTTYAIAIDPSMSNIVRIGGDNDLVDFDSYPSTVRLDTLHYDSSSGESEYTHEITTSGSDEYLYVYVSNEGKEADISIVNNSFVIPSHYLDLPATTTPPNETTLEKDFRYSINGDFSSVYEHPEIPDFISNPTTLTPAEYHSMFKDLIDSHPEILSRELLGSDNYSNDMYLYRLKPWEYHRQPAEGLDSPNHEKMKNPKIVITAGVHGREKSASYIIYYFVKQMLENLENNENLDAMLINIEFAFVPMACPSGFIDDSYGNRSGQNLNRDFPPYGNVSQPETEYIKEVLDNNDDMDYFIDFHNLLYKSNHIGYALTDDPFFSRAAMNAYKSVGRSWQKRYSGMPQEITHRWAYSTRANVGTVGKYVQDVLGIPSTIIEAPRQNNFFGDNSLHSEYCTRIGIDILVNTLNACVRNKQ